MVERDNVTHRANAQTTRTCARADRIQTRRRHPALVRTEVMLDTKTRNRSRAHRIIEARATVLHNADGASFLVWPRHGRNERTSSAITLIDLPWGDRPCRERRSTRLQQLVGPHVAPRAAFSSSLT